MVPTFAWCIFIRNRSTSKPLTDYEKQAITVAVQQALEQWHQSRAERRERVRAEMSKPVKSNMDDIDTVVLNLNNKDHILTRSLAVSHSSVAIDIDSDAVNVAIDVDEYDDADKDDIEPAAATLARARTLARVTTDVTIRPDQNASASHECCSVCIEELAVGDSVRVLPACRHVFHVACIDPWLTTASALCPLCKTDTRTSEEQAEYNGVVAAANASLEASAAVSVNISQGVHAIFNQIVDGICLERLGYVIKRDRSLSISASYVGNETTALFFRTTVFIRDGNGSEISNNGWRNRLLYGPGNRLRYPDLYVSIQRPRVQPGVSVRHYQYPPQAA
ncbi:hypothetical protein GQ42DRAFT_156506 [Ramicandelaber brevisporus]|nr:hypothetical protein GQ42DRAFT_156506 [Ramicandelaber brevisporus]